jgi:hypothetical protein
LAVCFQKIIEVAIKKTVGACTIHVYSHFDKVKISKNCKIDEVTHG